jgi:hypothetical protein
MNRERYAEGRSPESHGIATESRGMGNSRFLATLGMTIISSDSVAIPLRSRAILAIFLLPREKH